MAIGINACMTPMLYGLSSIFEDYSFYVDYRYSDGDLCLEAHFKIYRHVVHRALHDTTEKMIKRR